MITIRSSIRSRGGAEACPVPRIDLFFSPALRRQSNYLHRIPSVARQQQVRVRAPRPPPLTHTHSPIETHTDQNKPTPPRPSAPAPPASIQRAGSPALPFHRRAGAPAPLRVLCARVAPPPPPLPAAPPRTNVPDSVRIACIPRAVMLPAGSLRRAAHPPASGARAGGVGGPARARCALVCALARRGGAHSCTLVRRGDEIARDEKPRGRDRS